MTPQIFFFLLALSLLLGIASASDVHGAIEFSYSGKNGPDKWGNLDPTFSACSSGKKQSPINIQKNQTVNNNKSLKQLIRNYKPANATLINNGFNVGLRFEGNAGELSFGGKTYLLKQMHWHLPSEHKIDGKRFDAELHLVHRAADNSIAVVAILYQEKDADPLVSKIMNGLNKLEKEKCKADEVAEIPLGTLDVKHLKRSSRKYYRYVGSLTTPPCSENVIWSILGKVRSISKEQKAALEAPVNSDCKKNARPCQPLNGRKVELYDELDG
ncbi:hypothetical protein DITRI_Ditri12bG0134200 [Diplodiscus trichospermus]